jgi:hypothetical protein
MKKAVLQNIALGFLLMACPSVFATSLTSSRIVINSQDLKIESGQQDRYSFDILKALRAQNPNLDLATVEIAEVNVIAQVLFGAPSIGLRVSSDRTEINVISLENQGENFDGDFSRASNYQIAKLVNYSSGSSDFAELVINGKSAIGINSVEVIFGVPQQLSLGLAPIVQSGVLSSATDLSKVPLVVASGSYLVNGGSAPLLPLPATNEAYQPFTPPQNGLAENSPSTTEVVSLAPPVTSAPTPVAPPVSQVNSTQSQEVGEIRKVKVRLDNVRGIAIRTCQNVRRFYDASRGEEVNLIDDESKPYAWSVANERIRYSRRTYRIARIDTQLQTVQIRLSGSAGRGLSEPIPSEHLCIDDTFN